MFFYNVSQSEVEIKQVDRLRIYNVETRKLYDGIVKDGVYSDKLVSYSAKDGMLKTLGPDKVLVMYHSLTPPVGLPTKSSKTPKSERMYVLSFGNVNTKPVKVRTYRYVSLNEGAVSMHSTTVDGTSTVAIGMPLLKISTAHNSMTPGNQMYIHNKFFITWGSGDVTVLDVMDTTGVQTLYVVLNMQEHDVGSDMSDSEGGKSAVRYSLESLENGAPITFTKEDMQGKAGFVCSDYVTFQNDDEHDVMARPYTKYSNIPSYITKERAVSLGITNFAETDTVNVVSVPSDGTGVEFQYPAQDRFPIENCIQEDPLTIGLAEPLTKLVENRGCFVLCNDPRYIKLHKDTRGYSLRLFKNVDAKLYVKGTDNKVRSMKVDVRSRGITRSVDSFVAGNPLQVRLVGLGGRVGTCIEENSRSVTLSEDTITAVGEIGPMLITLVDTVTMLYKIVKVFLTDVVSTFKTRDLLKLTGEDSRGIVSGVAQVADTVTQVGSNTIGVAVNGVTTVAGHAVNGVTTVAGHAVNGATNVAGGIKSGVGAVTQSIKTPSGYKLGRGLVIDCEAPPENSNSETVMVTASRAVPPKNTRTNSHPSRTAATLGANRDVYERDGDRLTAAMAAVMDLPSRGPVKRFGMPINVGTSRSADPFDGISLSKLKNLYKWSFSNKSWSVSAAEISEGAIMYAKNDSTDQYYRLVPGDGGDYSLRYAFTLRDRISNGYVTMVTKDLPEAVKDAKEKLAEAEINVAEAKSDLLARQLKIKKLEDDLTKLKTLKNLTSDDETYTVAIDKVSAELATALKELGLCNDTRADDMGVWSLYGELHRANDEFETAKNFLSAAYVKSLASGTRSGQLGHEGLDNCVEASDIVLSTVQTPVPVVVEFVANQYQYLTKNSLECSFTRPTEFVKMVVVPTRFKFDRSTLTYLKNGATITPAEDTFTRVDDLPFGFYTIGSCVYSWLGGVLTLLIETDTEDDSCSAFGYAKSLSDVSCASTSSIADLFALYKSPVECPDMSKLGDWIDSRIRDLTSPSSPASPQTRGVVVVEDTTLYLKKTCSYNLKHHLSLAGVKFAVE